MRRDDRRDEPGASQPRAGGAPRTYLSRSYHLSITQEALQLNWSRYRQRRYREHRRDVPPAGSRLVRWSDRVAIICGDCRRPMGHCVAFSCDDLYGIVDDIAREPFGNGRPPSLNPPRGQKPYWVHISGNGHLALVTFHCRGCGRTYQPRNAHKLGSEITTKNLTELPIT